MNDLETDRAYAAWAEWLLGSWLSLSAGRSVTAPASLPHPSAAGFRRPVYTRGVGQSGDWVQPLADGSRLHVHEMPDGRLAVHRDATDPGRSVMGTAKHVWAELAPPQPSWLPQTVVGLDLDVPGRALAAVWWPLSVLSSGLSAYHGYLRNRSVLWALGWGLAGAILPVVTPAIAFAQGFGKRA